VLRLELVVDIFQALIKSGGENPCYGANISAKCVSCEKGRDVAQTGYGFLLRSFPHVFTLPLAWWVLWHNTALSQSLSSPWVECCNGYLGGTSAINATLRHLSTATVRHRWKSRISSSFVQEPSKTKKGSRPAARRLSHRARMLKQGPCLARQPVSHRTASGQRSCMYLGMIQVLSRSLYSETAWMTVGKLRRTAIIR